MWAGKLKPKALLKFSEPRLQQEGKFETDLESVLQKKKPKKTKQPTVITTTTLTQTVTHTYNDGDRTNVNVSSSTTRRRREAATDWTYSSGWTRRQDKHLHVFASQQKFPSMHICKLLLHYSKCSKQINVQWFHLSASAINACLHKMEKRLLKWA